MISAQQPNATRERFLARERQRQEVDAAPERVTLPKVVELPRVTARISAFLARNNVGRAA